ncbi:hypothetical protein [Brachybacterium sp. UMB0905]|uniref:hypothetical protein n=1 Tax=Brachybacterium sp. UMB0905 TaxID=2069310 RepID=UPI000C807166|nr:hypothetical protein [Brachybacterium sp. UMB0905]PMC76042.1 hypothetical protein CJ197_05130 [Brachybacterium sp. UMB0905]
MRRHTPALLATLATVLPWLSLLGPAWIYVGGPVAAEPLIALTDAFLHPISAVLVLVWLLLLPALLALVAYTRRSRGPGALWAGLAAAHAVLTVLIVIQPAAMVFMWDGQGADGQWRGGRAVGAPTLFFIPVLLGSVLLTAAALLAPGSGPELRDEPPEGPRDGTRGGRRVGIASLVSAVTAVVGLGAPLWWTPFHEDEMHLELLPAAARLHDGVPHLLWVFTAPLVVVLAVTAALRPRRLSALLLALLTVPLALLVVLHWLFALEFLLEDGLGGRLPGPGLALLSIAVLGALAGCWRHLRDRRSTAAAAFPA